MGHTVAEPELMPVDKAILSILPAQGERLGLRDLALQVKQITRTLNEDVPVEARLMGATVSGRMRTLKMWGLVVSLPVFPVSDGKGFQVTPLGQQHLNGNSQA